MSDMLEKLLGVEKTAARIVAEAETEAGRRTAQSRLDSQKSHSELLKKQAAENEAAISLERARTEAQRKSRNREERAKLERLQADQPTFRTAVLSIMDKASE